MIGKASKTYMRGVMSLLEREGYIFYINPNKITNKLEGYPGLLIIVIMSTYY